jgi:hypothetical protein
VQQQQKQTVRFGYPEGSNRVQDAMMQNQIVKASSHCVPYSNQYSKIERV